MKPTEANKKAAIIAAKGKAPKIGASFMVFMFYEKVLNITIIKFQSWGSPKQPISINEYAIHAQTLVKVKPPTADINFSKSALIFQSLQIINHSDEACFFNSP